VDGSSSPRPSVDAALKRGLGLTALPASRAEVESLRGLYPGAVTHLGRDATEERAKRVGEEASVLHFACHGLADSESPLDSALALTLPAEWRPGRENGLLQAWEVIEQMRLRADLVTLSACRTALGKTASGEGILGLTRAFHYAGARSVVASFWAVADAATADLMRRFYGHLRQGLSKDLALRAAQIELLERPTTSHPAHWAAFQLFGDWQ
jgi:CHAT domain-containing protein